MALVFHAVVLGIFSLPVIALALLAHASDSSPSAQNQFTSGQSTTAVLAAGQQWLIWEPLDGSPAFGLACAVSSPGGPGGADITEYRDPRRSGGWFRRGRYTPGVRGGWRAVKTVTVHRTGTYTLSCTSEDKADVFRLAAQQRTSRLWMAAVALPLALLAFLLLRRVFRRRRGR